MVTQRLHMDMWTLLDLVNARLKSINNNSLKSAYCMVKQARIVFDKGLFNPTWVVMPQEVYIRHPPVKCHITAPIGLKFVFDLMWCV